MMFRTSDKIRSLCEAREMEVNLRLVLYEHYADWTKMMRTKLGRVTKFMETEVAP